MSPESPPALLARLFGLDSRSLAAFRVGMGALVTLDALDRLRDLSAHYTDAGALPRALTHAARWRPSLFFWDGSATWAGLLLVLTALAGVAIAVGWRTRAATVLAWVLVVSVQARNLYVLYGVDTVVRISLLWAIFLPLAGHLSVDRRSGRLPAPPRTVLSPTTAIYTLQIVIIYLVTWWLKTGPAWADGTAGWYTLQADVFTRHLGIAMRAWPTVLSYGTHATMVLEVVGPLALFWPRGTWRIRAVVIAVFWAFHISLGLMLHIGWWSWWSVLLWLGLVPGEVWDRLGWRVADGEGPRGWRSWLPQVAPSLAFGLVLWWNLATAFHSLPAVRGHWRHLAVALRLDQNWNMYAPEPLVEDGWPVVELVLADGTRVDALRGGAPRAWAKPDDPEAPYASERWRKYFWSLWLRTSQEARPPYLDWVCRTWNTSHPQEQRALQATLYWMLERSPAPGQPEPEAVPQRLRRQGCDAARHDRHLPAAGDDVDDDGPDAAGGASDPFGPPDPPQD
ncbi:MAG: HTTM domain-containing protein [Alphaproteobacteria bacterium]|nr:HTTM domain-containing protein [Alphaproteobacteria bacterium]